MAAKIREQSYKPLIVERLFDSRKRNRTGQIENPIVTKEEVSAALEEMRARLGLSKKEGLNAANFFKDIIRRDDAEGLWPDRVFEAGYTGKQRTGNDNIFEFVPILPGQKEKFPNPYLPGPDFRPHGIQTASVNAIAKSLGMKGEAWMMQVLVQVKAIETHFSIFSPRRSRIRQIDHLQTGKKGSKAEIDGLYMALEEQNGKETSTLITVEAKGDGERIIGEQIEQQVVEAIKIAGKSSVKKRDLDCIVPCAVKSVKGRGIYFVEFEGFQKSLWSGRFELKVASEAIYTLEPPIKGI